MEESLASNLICTGDTDTSTIDMSDMNHDGALEIDPVLRSGAEAATTTIAMNVSTLIEGRNGDMIEDRPIDEEAAQAGLADIPTAGASPQTRRREYGLGLS